jgi:transposase-like protein
LALIVLSVVEQRLDAVRAALAGGDVTEVAARAGVHRSTVHRWMERYLLEVLRVWRSHRRPPQFPRTPVANQVAHQRRASPGTSHFGRPIAAQ